MGLNVKMARHLCIGCAIYMAMTAVLVGILSGCRSMPHPSDTSASEDQRHESPIVARINGEVLTYDALMKQYRLFFAMTATTEEQMQSASLELFLNQHILEVLLLQAARKDNIRVTPEEIEAERASYLEWRGLTETAMSDDLRKVDLGMMDVDHFLESNMIIDRLSQAKFSDMAVSDEDVQAFYDANPEYFYITDEKGYIEIPFEYVKDYIRNNLMASRIQTALLNYAMQLKEASEIQIHSLENSTEEPSVAVDTQIKEPEPVENDLSSESPFPTFRKTGYDICIDDQGRPIILLFSASGCSHCQWVDGVFDAVVESYTDRGLIEAHHFDIETGDDLLTETVETEIPEKYILISQSGNPDGYIPYFNFGCRYDRLGTGYEYQDDLAAEAEEMCQVIEALLP